MPISVSCACGKQLRSPDHLAGRRVKCPACDQILQVPNPNAEIVEPPRPRACKGLPASWIAAGAVTLLTVVLGAFALTRGKEEKPKAEPGPLADLKPKPDQETKPKPEPRPEPKPESEPAPVAKEEKKTTTEKSSKSDPETPPKSDPPSKKPEPPTVAVEWAVPIVPVADGLLKVQLTGKSSVKESLRFEYRLKPTDAWKSAPEGQFTIENLREGKLALEVRAEGERSGPSAVVRREWTVKPAEKKFDAASNVTIVGGVVTLKKVPPVVTDNGNALIKKYRNRMKMSASSIWAGWEAEKAIDDDIETSWFTAQGDAAALGKRPWLQAQFPEDVTLSRVTILGNREPQWLVGYTILEGYVQVYDRNSKLLRNMPSKGIGNYRDFDFKFNPPIEGARTIRFVSIRDQGNHTVHKDIAIAEFQAD